VHWRPRNAARKRNSQSDAFSNVMGVKKLSGGICAIDLEAFVGARELLDNTEIVECGSHVEEFRVEAQFPLTTLLSREQVDTDRVIKEQIIGVSRRIAVSPFASNESGMTRAFGVVISWSF
jgi:hypothetical protein